MKKLILIFFFGLTVPQEQTIAQNITANFTFDTVCSGDSTCFTDLSTSPTYSITTWNWDFGDASTQWTYQNPCHTYSSPGNYTVTLIVTNSNGDKDTVQHPVTINTLPIAVFISSTNGDTTFFTDMSQFNPPLCSFFWSFGDGDTSTLQNPQHIYATSGTYTVCYTVTTCNQGCQNTACQTVNITTGIFSQTVNSIIKISPNPFCSQTVLQTDNLLHNATLTVDNCFGQTVAQIKNLNGQTITFFRDNLASGLYFVRLTEENKTIAVDKLVIADK